MTSAYGSLRFTDRSSAILLGYRVHSGPIPPVVVKIRGENEPFSICSIRALYAFFFSLSCSLYSCSGCLSLYEGELGCITRTSRKVRSIGLYSPMADTSSLALSAMLFACNSTPPIGISSGSTLTFLQTSLSRLASKSLMLLCRMWT